jgi:glycine/D-amino acid oxidase-like deaminating enzyme
MALPPRTAAPPPSGSVFDLIVIGGGTIGLSAAYYGSARRLKTLLLEQFGQIADPHASSGGYSRMFRVMYSPSYMAQLAEISLALWQEI